MHHLHEMVTGRVASSMPNSSSPRPISKKRTWIRVKQSVYFGHECVNVSTVGAGSIVAARSNRAVGAVQKPIWVPHCICLSHTASDVVNIINQWSWNECFCGWHFFFDLCGCDWGLETRLIKIGIGIEYLTWALYAGVSRKHKQSSSKLFEGVERLSGEKVGAKEPLCSQSVHIKHYEL